MLIECDRCEVRGRDCGGCVVTALLGAPATGVIEIDERERRALGVLADLGMIPPLRLTRTEARAS